MRILVTGKNGQLGRSIQKLVNADAKSSKKLSLNDFTFVGRQELNLTSESAISQYLVNNKFDIIINCAAYTKVDSAEEEPDLANQINYLAVKKIASIANKYQTRLIHISTDYVFDGENIKPYLETDTPNPINTYGRTKLAGEQALQTVMPMNAIIIRTSWVYSEYGNNFVRTMLKLGKKQDELKVVFDQIGSPTYATNLAETILTIIKSKTFNEKSQTTKIYHYSNDGEISWYDFAKKIFEIAKIDCKVNKIKSEQFPLIAKRPKNTCLHYSKIIENFGIKVIFWKVSLGECINQIQDQLKTKDNL